MLSSDGKVRIEATDLSTFPDLSIVCGEVQTSKVDSTALTNPILLAEVTSPSTKDYDRGAKLNHYKQISSLRVVLLVSHEQACVTVIHRGATSWEQRDFSAGAEIDLPEPRICLSINELYEDLKFPSASI